MRDINIKSKYINIKYSYKDEVYVYYILENNNDKHGWKIHISCTNTNFQKILDIVSKYSLEHKIDFKYIYNLDILNLYLSSRINYTAVGKFIVIYPIKDKFSMVVKDLYKKLYKFKGILINSDDNYKNSIVHFRYGNINGKEKYYLSNEGILTYDNVERFYIPDGEEFPIKEYKEIIGDIIGKEIIPYKIIQKSTSGNVYRCKYKNKDYILKEARGFINVDKKITAIDKLKHESMLLKYIKCSRIFPVVYKEFYEFNNYYILKNFLKGVSLTLAISDLKFKDISLKQIILFLEDILYKAHKKNIILNDISTNNFIIDYSNIDKINIGFCDLGSSYFEKEYIKKIDYEDISNIFYDDLNLFSKERSDYHKLGYILINIIAPFNYYLRYDRTGNITLNKINQFLGTENKNIYNLIYYLIRDKKFTRKEFLNKLSKIDNLITIKKLEDLEHNNDIESILSKIKDKINKYGEDRIIKFKFLEYEVENIELKNILDFIEKNFKHKKNIKFLINEKVFAALLIKLYMEKNCKKNNIKRIDRILNLTDLINLDQTLIKGELGKSLLFLLMYLRIGDIKYYNKYLYNLKKVENKIEKKYGFYYLKNNEEIINPYINKGICGFILAKIIEYKITNNIDILESIKKYIFSLIKEKHIYKLGLIDGGLGIFALVYEYSKITNNIFLYSESLKILNNLLNLDVEINGKYFIPNYTFEGFDFSFLSGSIGYIFILNKVIQEEGILDEFNFKKQNI